MLEAPGPPFIQMMFGVTLEIRICVRPQIRHFHSCPFPILTNPALPLSIQSAELGNKSTRTRRCKRSFRWNQQKISFSSGVPSSAGKMHRGWRFGAVCGGTGDTNTVR